MAGSAPISPPQSPSKAPAAKRLLKQAGKQVSKHGGLALFLASTGIPLLLGLGYALLESIGAIAIINPGLTSRHWLATLGQRALYASFAHSAYIAAASMALAIPLALWISLRLRHLWQGRITGTLLYYPLAMPAMVAGFTFFQLAGQSGLFSRMAYALGLINNLQAFPNLTQDSAGAGILMAHTFLAAPFFTILFLNIYRQEGVGQLLAVASTLGSNTRQALRRIAVPLLLRRAYPTLVLYTIFMFSAYEIPLLLDRQSPQMVSVYTIRKLQGYDLAAMPQGFIVALLYTVFVMVALWIALPKERQQLHTTSPQQHA